MINESISVREYVDAKISDLEGQVDRRVATTLRELGDLRAYFNIIAAEKDRAVEVATVERKEAMALLRDVLEQSISAGDARLREHIENQIQQVHADDLAADTLERQRIEAVAASVVAVRRELEAASQAQKEAITKAEAATEKRFEGVNEWRGQSADRERSQQEQAAKLMGTFMPREVADAQLAEMRKQLSTNTDRLNTESGAKAGAADLRVAFMAVIATLATVAAIVVPHIH